jgi:transposase
VSDNDYLFQKVPADRFGVLNREELIQYIQGQQDFNDLLEREVKRLREKNKSLEERTLLLGEQFVVLKNRVFGKSSEKAAAPDTQAADDLEDPGTDLKDKKEKKKKIRLPSERYPDAPLIEQDITLKDLPPCRCCGELMSDSGMTEDLEFITKIPEQFYVVRQKKRKYRCGHCHGDIQTAPAPPRIKEGSAYSDEMIIDTAVKKFCDLIPIQRQTKMAERAGFPGLPPQSLIETTHYLANTLRPVYGALKTDVFSNKVLNADETPHRMLEGSEISNWYFWGFSSQKSAYFEAHDTRSGDVASNLLKNSNCEHLMSDVFSGYQRAVRLANEERVKEGKPLIQNNYCNAHARRKFKEAEVFEQESKFFLSRYSKIYFLESQSKGKPPDEAREIRLQMKPIFEEMRIQATAWLECFSTKSSLVKAMNYFLKNYREFTRFTEIPEIPIDNNSQERLLRNPVIGRKTWYGTHSKRGAETTAILFSIIESCKLNKINPRHYLKAIIEQIHANKPIFTPKDFVLNQPDPV